MNIGFDFEGYQIARNRGIGNYALNLCNAFFRSFPQNNYFILLWEKENINEKFSEYPKDHVSVVVVSQDNITDKEHAINKFINENSLDIYWDIAPMIRNGNLFSTRCNKTLYVATVYDLIPYVFKEEFFYDVDHYIHYFRKMLDLNRYDILFSISDSTKKDVIQYCGVSEDSIYNIYMSGNENCNLNISNNNSILDKFGIESKYYLCVSGNGFHKNLLGLIRGYIMASKTCSDLPQLVIVASLSDTYSQISRMISTELFSKNKILYLGFVSDDDLNLLYRHAFWSICPSLYEGFGMPVLESWIHNTPVIASETSSVGEIAGGASYIIDPNNIISISDAFLKTFSFTDKERKNYIYKGTEKAKNFSWDKTVKSSYEILEKYIGAMREDNDPKNKMIIDKQLRDERIKAEKIWGISDTNSVIDDNLRKFTEYPILMKWLLLYENNSSIDKFFIKNGINSVAIYGLGFWGMRVLKDLIKRDIEIKCVIDKRAKYLNLAGCSDLITIISPTDPFPGAECVLIALAPAYVNKELKKSISRYAKCPVYDLNDIFEQL